MSYDPNETPSGVILLLKFIALGVILTIGIVAGIKYFMNENSRPPQPAAAAQEIFKPEERTESPGYNPARRADSYSSGGALERYRTEYGRIDVRRVEADCIRLAPAERPFDPSKAAAITFAAEQLASTGAYQGLLPVGSYQVGPHRADIRSGAAPTTVQRIAGDGDCR